MWGNLVKIGLFNNYSKMIGPKRKIIQGFMRITLGGYKVV